MIEAEVDGGSFDIGLSMRLAPAAQGRARPRDGSRRTGKAGAGTVLRRETLAWVAAPGDSEALGVPLPLVLLPDTCSCTSMWCSCCGGAGSRYVVMHSASGVAGLQLALAAGLGLSCLNASAIRTGHRHAGCAHAGASAPAALAAGGVLPAAGTRGRGATGRAGARGAGGTARLDAGAGRYAVALTLRP